ncbi:MAG: XRE family transcriptional regulator [Desulfobacteraceae bacterium]|nr:MAG: XRE family transcriptional regulator [Desulfobacteraceae bacterium]
MPTKKPRQSIDEAEIGSRIRAFRTEKGITLESLAQQTGFTKGYLSKVEKSKKAPPVSTLGILAKSLGVTISSLLGEEIPRTSFCLVRKGERPMMTGYGGSSGYAYEALAQQYPGKIMEPFVLTLPVKPNQRKLFQHEGQEILFVLKGKMRFRHGSDVYIMDEGDCAYFDSGIPHLGESFDSEETQCFLVIHAPNGRGR